MSKKIIAILALVGLVAGGVSSTHYLENSHNTKATTKIESHVLLAQRQKTGTVCNLNGYPYLHLRAQGDEYSNILKDLPSGTQVNILGEAGGWYHVEVSGVTGWVYSNYLSVNGSTPGINSHMDTTYSNVYGTVGNLDGYPHLHVRSNGTTGAPIIADLANGTSVKILGESGGWYRIDANGTIGWVYSLYINKGGAATTSTTKVSNAAKASTSSVSSKTGVVANLDGYPYLHMRSNGTTAASIIKDLPSGTQVNILGEAGGWYHINVNGTTGWVYSIYINTGSSSSSSSTSSKSSSSSATVSNSSSVGIVTNLDGYPYLHVRAQGDEYSKIVKVLRSGTKVNVLGEDGGWYHIDANGTTGWVYSNYLSVNGSMPGQNTHVAKAYSNTYGTVGNLNGYPHLHVRSNGTTGAPIIADLSNGTKVQVLGEDGGWYRISANGVTGWVYSLYINM